MMDTLNSNPLLTSLNSYLAQLGQRQQANTLVIQKPQPGGRQPLTEERLRGMQALLQARSQLRAKEREEEREREQVRATIGRAPAEESAGPRFRLYDEEPAARRDPPPQEEPRREPAALPRRPLNQEESDQLLASLVMDARLERLEVMVALLEALRTVLAVDQSQAGAPPGTLTVSGWISLFQRWESTLQRARKRQIFYSHSFLKDTLNRPDVLATSLSDPLQELSETMERYLEVE